MQYGANLIPFTVIPAPPAALYLHVPFCPSICPYCDFHKMKRHDGLVGAYLNRLEQESAELRESYPLQMRTIYLGGGTRSEERRVGQEGRRGRAPRRWSQ